ncbi:MAG: hypothetical protein WDO17_12340 [Alphaproteobacteria bacterium]
MFAAWSLFWSSFVAVLIWLWHWFRVLWVCRVATLASIGGGLFIVYLPQTLDLFADTGLRWWHWSVFLFLVFSWAWIVHITGRRALQYDDWLCEARQTDLSDDRRSELRAKYYCPALLIPRVLGILVFVFVGYAMWTARRNLGDAVEGLPPAREAVSVLDALLVLVAIIAVGYTIAVVRRRKVAASLAGRALPDPPLLAGKIPLLALVFEPITRGLRGRLRTSTRIQIALAIAWTFITIIFFVAVANPHGVADWFPRVLLLPVVIAGGVLLFGEFAALSHRWETPLLLVFVGVSALLAKWSDHYNDTRWFSALPHSRSAAVGETAQITFAQALERWRAANPCDGNATPCPQPLIIAAAGGASRAAFQTVSVLGAMLDLGLAEKATYGNVRNRIFAISSVSGSSVGATVMRAALTDALEAGNPDMPPCKQSSNAAWWGATKGADASGVTRKFDPTKSWLDCLQQLTAGDYLSPVTVGLAYRDNFPLGKLWADRAVLLEEGFERRYYNVTNKGAKACDATTANGMCRRFGYHPDPRTAGAWIPLLFINGTSVSTGRRILTSDVSAGDLGDGKAPLVKLAYDIGELRNSRRKDGKADDPSEGAGNLLLSTAATMSCRFPVISPHGTIRDRKGEMIDRIVDGGYYENDGLATATDIVNALKKAGLKPIIVRIGNEPEHEISADRDLGRPGPKLPDASESALFDVYLSIVRGLLATRSGHEDALAEIATNSLDGPDRMIAIGVRPVAYDAREPGPFCRQKIGTKATMKIVSMSWWMSQPVQAYLDAQLCVPENWQKLACALRLDGRCEAARRN